MTAEKETLRRVQDGLFHLQKGLTPFVEARMKAGTARTGCIMPAVPQASAPNAALDAYGLLKTMIDNWRDVFERHSAATKSTRRATSPRWRWKRATPSRIWRSPLQDDEALRYLDAMHQLLGLVKAPAGGGRGAQAALRRAARSPALPRRRQRRRRCNAAPQPELDLAPREGDSPARRCKPWIEVALPHPDVLANRFKEAEFAADLFAVDAGHASEDYATPENFFRITFLTEG